MAITATYIDATHFTVAADRVAEFLPDGAVGLQVKADCGADGTKYCTVTAAGYASPSTTVTVAGDDLTANLAMVLHGNDGPKSLTNHAAQHAWNGRDVIYPSDIGAAPATVVASGGLTDARVTGNAGLAAGHRYRAVVTAAASLTLPASPTDGDVIEVLDAGRNSATYNLTVGRNGKTIDGNAGDFVMNQNGMWARFVYDATTGDWFLAAGYLGA